MTKTDKIDLLIKILKKNRIDKIADIESCTFKRFIDFLYVAFDEKKINYKQNKIYYVLLFSLNIIRVNLYYFIKRINGKTDKVNSAKYVFVPCDGMFERFKYLPEFVDYSDYAIVYFPPFRVNYIFKNYKYFMNKGEVVLAPKFYLSCISALFKFVWKNKKIIDKTIKELDETKQLEGLGMHMCYYLLKYVVYAQFANEVIHHIKMGPEKKIWFFDNELVPIYLACINVLRKNRSKDKTINIQHGMFWMADSSYLNPLCDYTFTSSEREKKMYLDSGLASNSVFVVGAPLQSLLKNRIQQQRKDLCPTNILVLATSVESEIYKKIQKELFTYLNNNSFEYRVRIRPGTRVEDWNYFSHFLESNQVTDKQNTLEEDIQSSKVVISFSIDALIKCFSQQKKVAFIVPSQYNNFHFVGKFDNNEVLITSNISDLGLFINHLYQLEYSDSTQIFIANNFGEYRFSKVKALYQRAIKEIENK